MSGSMMPGLGAASLMPFSGVVSSGWRNLDTRKPSGVSADIEALYQLDDSADWLTDLSGRGRNLVVGGTTPTLVIQEGIVGRAFWDTTNDHLLASALGDAALGAACIGACSVEIVGSSQGMLQVDGAGLIFQVGGVWNSEAEADNVIFTVRIAQYRNSGRVDGFQEQGLGANVAIESNLTWSLGLSHLVLTKNADGVTHEFYCQGAHMDTVVAANAATGGSNSNIKIGGLPGQTLTGCIFSVRLWFVELTAAQVLDSYNYLRAG
jgi:hypothetical protein